MSDVEFDSPALAEKYDYLSDPQFDNGVLLVKELQVKKGHHALDIGCGTGRLASHVAQIVGKNGKVIGIDPSPFRIKVANNKVKRSFNTSFKVGRGEYLSSFREKSFDRVYLNAVFHWIENKEATLAEVHRILKPGGKVGLTSMPTVIQKAFFTYRQAADELLKKEPYASQVKSERETPTYPITTDELVLLLINSGFQDIKLNLKKKTRYYPTAKEFLDFLESSFFGNFLINVPDNLRYSFRSDIEKELEKKKTSKGIEHTNYTLFVTATKN